MAGDGAAVDGDAAAGEGVVEGGGGEECGIVDRQIFDHGAARWNGASELPLAGSRYSARVHGGVTAARCGPYAIVEG